MLNVTLKTMQMQPSLYLFLSLQLQQAGNVVIVRLLPGERSSQHPNMTQPCCQWTFCASCKLRVLGIEMRERIWAENMQRKEGRGVGYWYTTSEIDCQRRNSWQGSTEVREASFIKQTTNKCKILLKYVFKIFVRMHKGSPIIKH